MLKAIEFIQQKLVIVLNPRTALSAILFSVLSACYITTSSDDLSVVAPAIKANCQYVDPAVVSGLSSENPYDNGYRLVSEKYESEYSPSFATYKYDPTSSTVDVLRIPEDRNGRYLTAQYLDNSGRLSGGDHEERSPVLKFIHSYQLGYDNDSRVVSFDRDGARSFDFDYEQGRLIEISRPGLDNNRDRKVFNYDDSGNLVSVYEYEIDLSYFYTCNEENQITSLHAVRDGVNEGYYSFRYDDNGNLSELKRISRTGHVFFTRTFDYEISTAPTFNLWRLRTSMGLLPSTDKLIH